MIFNCSLYNSANVCICIFHPKCFYIHLPPAIYASHLRVCQPSPPYHYYCCVVYTASVNEMSVALKFTSLFLRTLAKPLANSIKSHARDHPSFRHKCIYIAQSMHKTEITLRRNLLNEKNQKVKPLNDARAIQAGANFVAESFVFSVAGALILFESWRSRRKEKDRQASVADDIKFLQDEIVWIKEKLKESMVIRQGEDAPIPNDLQPLVLKWVKEGIASQQIPSKSSPSKENSPEEKTK